MPYDYSFDATQFEPNQGGGPHPKGKFPATISNTLVKPTKTGDGGLFEVEFTTQSGSINNRYNLWNKEPKAVEIAHKELSALCHATGIFKLDFRNDAAVLRGAHCIIEVDDQKAKDGTPTGYVEVKKVYDMAGNEPGRVNPMPQPMAQQAPQQTLQQAPQTAAPAANGGWGTPTSAPAAAPPAAPSMQGWQPGPTVAPSNGQASGPSVGAPPWAK